MIYLHRLRSRLPTQIHHCTPHRIFLSAVILAAKYFNDTSLKNKYWAKYSLMFGLDEVNIMERELLGMLDFDLRIDEPELLAYAQPLFAAPQDLQLRIPPDVMRCTSDIKEEQDRYARAATHRLLYRYAPPLDTFGFAQSTDDSSAGESSSMLYGYESDLDYGSAPPTPSWVACAPLSDTLVGHQPSWIKVYPFNTTRALPPITSKTCKVPRQHFCSCCDLCKSLTPLVDLTT